MITFFYAKFLYLNPGMSLLYEELERRHSDGIRVCDVTQLRMDQLDDAIAASDAIVIDTSIQDAATWTIRGKFSIYFIVDQQPSEFYDEVLERLLNANVAKLFALYVDLHDQKNRVLLERIRGRVDAISWSFERQPRGVADVPAAHRDSWLTPQVDPLPLWRMTREYFPLRVDLPFSLAAKEYHGSWPHEVFDACVPGAPYLTRQVASRSMRAAGIRVAPFQFPARVLNAGCRYVLPTMLPARRASEMAIRLQQSFQRTVVRSAPIGFVCGGPLAYPVRKFFEIPGSRLAMIADPCPEMTDYGFADGKSFLATSPEDAGKVAKRLRGDSSAIRRIAAAGFETVRSLHSVEQRADQLVECVARLARGTFRGARFVRGTFEIE